MSLLSLGQAVLNDLEAAEIPVLIQSLTLYQGNQTPLGKAAAITYLMANAPIAAIEAEGTAVNQLLTTAIAALQAQLAKIKAPVTSGIGGGAVAGPGSAA